MMTKRISVLAGGALARLALPLEAVDRLLLAALA